MASVGVEFDQDSLDRIFKQSADYYHAQFAQQEKRAKSKKKLRSVLWAINPIYDNNHPQRPWGLGSINKATSLFYWFAGEICRTPGLYKETDPVTNKDTTRLLQDTNERVHSTVRIRLACKGLGLNDKKLWDCPALSRWKLKKTTDKFDDPVPLHPGWDPEADEPPEALQPSDGQEETERWVWEYVGDEKSAPQNVEQRRMVEEPLGPYERYYLEVSGGSPNVFDFAKLRHQE